MDRRRLLQAGASLGGLGLLGVGGCATPAASPTAAPLPASPLAFDPVPPLAPIRARLDRVFDVTVCLRPFRAAGPRLDAERIGDALVVHNYGHGGSGWSLSWGSSALAVRTAMGDSPRELAVVGCGALGITSAILAQNAGAAVTIYARDLLPDARSARATGSWTPDSRIALESAAGPGFGAVWEDMARTSFKTYRRYLGLPGAPVEWADHYILSDRSPDDPGRPAPPDSLGFASYVGRIRDLTPRAEALPADSTPFPTPYVRRFSALTFNIAGYAHTLLEDFRAAGGRIERREFKHPSELGGLKQKVVINCPGYGARALWRDESVVPVRGQISWLIPQPGVDYGLHYKDVNVLGRRDGIVVQDVSGGDMNGYNDAREVVDRAETERTVGRLAELYRRPWRTPSPPRGR